MAGQGRGERPSGGHIWLYREIFSPFSSSDHISERTVVMVWRCRWCCWRCLPCMIWCWCWCGVRQNQYWVAPLLCPPSAAAERERESPGWLERLKKSMIAAAAAAVFAVRETGRDTRTCCGSSSALSTCLSLCLSPCEVWPQVFQAAGEPAVVSSYILPAGLQWAVISPLSV